MPANTKEIIWQKALALFSTEGYAGVSVKAIADAVGIKDSSLYKHYKSKQEIFETILQEASQRMAEAKGRLTFPSNSDEVGSYQKITSEELSQICYALFSFYLKDEIVSKFRRMLTIEQYRNQAAARLFQKMFIEEALEYQTALFRELIQSGHLSEGDPAIMAMHFYAPLFLMLYQYDKTEEDPEELHHLIKKLTDSFSANYGK